MNFKSFVENAERVQALRDRMKSTQDKFKAGVQKDREEHQRRIAVAAQNEKRKRVRSKLDAAGVSDDEGDFDDVD
jgi:hypothetical protein